MNTVPEVKQTPMEQFKEKLSERVRDDIRDLLPEDAVNAMVEEAVRDTFFKPRSELADHYSHRRIEKPSWFVEAVATASEPILREAVNKYIEQNRAIIEKATAEYLTPQNLTVLAVGRLSAEIGVGLNNLATAIMERR